MSIVNEIRLTGHIGQKPEKKSLNNDSSVTKFTVATNKVYKNQKGEKVTKTIWHNVVAFGKIGEIVHQYLDKGAFVQISGESHPRSYETENGEKKFTHEIILDDINFLDKK
jgi:single-strand DNA-binding protein